MNRHGEVIQPDRLSCATRKDRHVRRQGQLARDHPLRVVVSLHDEAADAGALQSHHLTAKEEAGVKILPISVVDVACEQEEIHSLGQRPVYQPLQRTAGGATQPINRRTVVPVQAT